MGNQIPECCQQALINDISDLREQTSSSLALIEKSKQEQQEIDGTKSTLKLESIHSSKSINHGLKNKDNVLFEIPASIKINESWTTSADHKLEEAVITEPIKHKYKNKKNHPKRDKNIIISMEEIKEKDIFHDKYDVVDSGLDFNELYTKTTLIKAFRSISTEKTYDSDNDNDDELLPLSPPIPIAINWSNSNNSDIASSNITPSTTNNSNLNYSAAITPISALTLSPTPDIKDEEYWMGIDDECISIDSCPSIKRIINALQWYSMYGADHQMLYKKMKINNYGKEIMNDYNHIIDYHLNIDIKSEYNSIINEINKYVEPCNFIQCGGYQRYLRSRNKNVHKAQNSHQHEVQMYVNTMDGIHSCFMHLANNVESK